METRTDRAKTQIQIAERLLLIARLLWRAGVSHKNMAGRLAEEYRNVEPADAEAKASIGRRIAAHAKTPGPIMKDSVDRMAAVMREAAESRLLDAEGARIAAMYPGSDVSWWEYLALMQRHYCGLASPTMGDMDVTANAIESIARGIVAASVGGSGKKRAGTRKTKAKRFKTTRPLTNAQSQAFAEYCRFKNVAIVAKELGISRSAAHDRIKAALEKTGQAPDRATRSVRAKALPTDSRGQATVIDD